MAGEVLEVDRSWPRPDGTLLFDAADAAGRLRAGRVRDGRIEVLPAGEDPRLRPAPGGPRLAAPGTGARLLVHRWGRRAVLRETAAGPRADAGPGAGAGARAGSAAAAGAEPGGTVYRKLLRPGKAPAVARVSDTMAGLAARAGLGAPRVLGHGGGHVVFSALPGRELSALAGSGAWDAAWGAWAQAWPRLLGERAPGGFAVHDARREAGVLRDWAGHLAAFDPLGLDAAERAHLERRVESVVGQLAEDGAAAPLVPCHRDLHERQLLYDAATGRIGLLDFDTAALAERELDLGNLLAHLVLRVDQGSLHAGEAAAARRHVLSVSDAVGADPGRLEAYTASASLRLACVYAFRPKWRPLARIMLWRNE
ncbi:phosphotransferase family protein [Zafaria sp. Z1313]|uniref:phosphotransferase n=1 Tax=unclassified Zafaria TaxID=2828765 RepID=UPI002E76274B|nr:phosphotransferase [Zafaria sp. J156]MEE1620620.1 phosphotransferase [Zafaria sp. J156]